MEFVKKNILYIAWTAALVSMFGSLYFSEVLKYAPCVLCWYQRIAMYPLVVILAVGIWRRDKLLPYYVLPLAIVGLIISVYHNLLYYGVMEESVISCTSGISCTTRYIQWFGFMTIPFLAMMAFLVIIASMIIYQKHINDQRS